MITRKIVFVALVLLVVFGFVAENKPYKLGKTYDIQINDTNSVFVNQVIDKESGETVFYYSDFIVPACNTGECKLIDMRMYWDIFGNYFKYEVKKSNPLTKYNHKKFKKKEYRKLHRIICDTSLVYRTLDIKDLTSEKAEEKYKTDAMSGATLKIFADKNRIKGAVKTVYTLWHIANGNVHKTLSDEINFDSKSKEYNTFISLIENEKVNEISKLNLSSFAKLLRIIELNTNLQNKKTYKLLNSLYKNLDKDKTFLLSDFFIRNKIKNSKAIKVIKYEYFMTP